MQTVHESKHFVDSFVHYWFVDNSVDDEKVTDDLDAVAIRIKSPLDSSPIKICPASDEEVTSSNWLRFYHLRRRF